MAKKHFDPLQFAFDIIKENHVRRMSLGSRPQLISYQSDIGLYALGDLPIEQEAQHRFSISACLECGSDENPTPVTEGHVREILNAVRRNAPVLESHELNDPTRDIIIFQNGVLHLPSLELEDHSPEHLYSMGIPHNWNPDAECSHYRKFLGEVLPSEAHPLIGEIKGLLLIPSTRFRKFFVYVGTGMNGKSIEIEVTISMLGPRNVSNQSLHALSSNRFSLSALHGKLTNTHADLDSLDVSQTGLLKQIVAGDTVSYEKKHRDPFSGPVSARLLFSANDMPTIKDTSRAVIDRLIMQEFPYRFEGKKQRDKDELLAELTDENEIEGIIAQYAVPGLLRLMDTGRFSLTERNRQLVETYRRDSDPVVDFFESQLEVVANSSTARQDLFLAYCQWCRSEGIQPLSQRELNRRIELHFEISRHEDFREPGSRKRAWRGIQLKNPENPEEIPEESRAKAASVLAYPGNPKK